MNLEVSGIVFEVIKKDIKNLHLSVLPPNGSVRVSAPERLSDESIRLFVRTKIGWIRKQQQQFEDQRRQTERQYISGETLYVWGKHYFLQTVYSFKGNSINLSGDKAILTVRKESTPEQRGSFVNEWYREILKTEIKKRLPEWETRTGLFCSSWQTKYMTTRWGTCNPDKGKIWINLQMAKKPLECLDYILLHELTHLKYRDHGEEFVTFMDSYMPYWREARKLLNDSVLDYMEE